MKRIKITIVLTLFCFLLSAQDEIVKIWPGKIPGSIKQENYREQPRFSGSTLIATGHVSEPALFVYRAQHPIGTGIIVCPGGSYKMLSIDNEGTKVAKWLNTLGITAFVLKYRMPGDSIMENKTIAPLQDIQESMRMIRRNAVFFGILPGKMGVIGFSAGGHLASTLSTKFSEVVYPINDTTSARPDFAILVYPVISLDSDMTLGGSRPNLLGSNPSEELVKEWSSHLHVSANTPPTFIVHAANDPTVPVVNSVNYFMSLKKNGVAGELHIFGTGGHGFGLGTGKGTVSEWPVLCESWLRSIVVIK